ncbi:MlaD family protein [Parabacteroides sp. PF5-6]|uniref:MlaD family protein n=1 Tax=Parabacteroides sp. PF5-6 TaxID=1742403 RepID=UPI0024062166|nr:MlaD family protein [Parabacteroides sp. PF5-6]MDF9830281.1 phospholipid/cholesterol/gamma-HCH transport system substrate-binding protein [Parabacteroides sp. PF5-6]
MKHSFTKEAKIGLVTIISLVLLYIGINFLKGIDLFKPVNHYFVSFDNVKDLTVSSPVYVEGYKVGLVRSIAYDYKSAEGRIVVEISLDKEMKVNKDSYILISKSLLSGAELHLHLNKYVSEYLKSGSVIEGRMEEDMMASIQEKILPGVAEMLPKIDSILAGLEAIVNHPALSQSLTHIERTTSNLEVSTRELNRLLDHDVPVIVGNLKTMTDNFSVVSGTIKDLDFATTITEINATLANLRMTTEKLNSNDNSLGLLMNDKALYENLNKTTQNASDLLFDLRQNPKRYVHFSIF